MSWGQKLLFTGQVQAPTSVANPYCKTGHILYFRTLNRRLVSSLFTPEVLNKSRHCSTWLLVTSGWDAFQTDTQASKCRDETFKTSLPILCCCLKMLICKTRWWGRSSQIAHRSWRGHKCVTSWQVSTLPARQSIHQEASLTHCLKVELFEEMLRYGSNTTLLKYLLAFWTPGPEEVQNLSLQIGSWALQENPLNGVFWMLKCQMLLNKADP